jgi:lipid A disaccharide synthetase
LLASDGDFVNGARNIKNYIHTWCDIDHLQVMGIFEMVQKTLKILFIHVVMLAALQVIGDF